MDDRQALAQRDALTTLFWGSLLTFLNVGAFGLSIPPLIGWPVVAIALARLRAAGAEDDRYQRRLGVGVVTAWLALVLTLTGPLPWAGLRVAGPLMDLAHALVVCSAMIRFGRLRSATAVHRRWVVARGLHLALLTLWVFMLSAFMAPAAPPRAWPSITLVAVVVPASVAACVMYLVAIWTTRRYVERAAAPAAPNDVAAVAISG